MSDKPAQFIEVPTMDLRFIERRDKGRRILQQRFDWKALDEKSGGHEWRDVPCVTDEAEQT